uniref:Uncharacterized protein n=1 Tax=Candidatus Kentrum sp. FW TaxID=2126338 RepID=A0A450TWA2_9GAMM|nr:MAG: hypothetical protein BECKFW1821C_GA0114237_10486 [Candidatus Kentron sp. FW]
MMGTAPEAIARYFKRITRRLCPSYPLGPDMGMLPSLVLGPGIPCRDDVRVVATSHVIPAGNAGT